MSAKCSACGAAIVWANHSVTGKPNPIDAEPSPEGNIELNADGKIYRIVPKAQRAAHAGRLRKSHFVTCPEAASFRGGR